MASYPPYIPPADAEFLTWLENFNTLLTAAPADFGLTAGDATAVDTVAQAFITSYPISQDPSTRTPVTVATKDADRAAAEAVIRPYAVTISRDANVTNGNKEAIGVTVPSVTPTPIPAPTDAPELGIVALNPLLSTLSFKTTGAVGKSKPFGATGVEIATAVGVAHTVDPSAATYQKTVTKSPFRLTFSSPDQGSHLTVFARFRTQSGPSGESQAGPWSAPLQTFVV